MKNKKLLLTILTLGLLIISCGNNTAEKVKEETKIEQNEINKKENIVTSIPPLKWITQKIAGNDFNVISIIQPNMNHELFEPKPEDLKILEDSKVFFTYNALSFEENIANTLKDSNKVTNLLKGIDENLLLENEHDHHHEHGHNHKEENHHHDEKFDPHVWFSLDLMPIVAENIKNKLVELYPDKKDSFNKNYNNFLIELSNFEKEISEKISQKKSKIFMIYHPALNYFTHDFGIEEIAVEYQGKEPSAKQIKEIIEEAKEHNITTILVQPQFPKESIETISKELPNSKIVEFNADEENVFENLKKFVDNLQ